MATFFNPYAQQYVMQPQVQQPPQQMQIQNGGFVTVRNETEARNYPVAYGNSVTFKDETAPYVYTKTMGFSQLDRPIFEKYKLVKEDTSEASKSPQNDMEESKQYISMIDDLKNEISTIWDEINHIEDELKNDKKSTATTKRGKDDGD